MEAKEMIRQFIKTEIVSNHNGNGVADDDSLIEGGILDSLGIIKLLSFFEAELSLTVGNEDLMPGNFESIDTISTFVENKLSL